MIDKATLTDCSWQAAGGGAVVAEKIAAFLSSIGISIEVTKIDGLQFVPGLAVRDGGILVDPATTVWPGDLLHEAGHIAVTSPDLRGTMSDVSDDPGEEMAAIAWSWAAACACIVEPRHLFHAEGYKGGSTALIDNFTAGRFIGVPMLAWFGMTSEPASRLNGVEPVFPAMARWLR